MRPRVRAARPLSRHAHALSPPLGGFSCACAAARERSGGERLGLRCEGGNGGRGAGGAGGRLRRDADGERGDVSSCGRSHRPRLLEPILRPSIGRSGGQRHAQPERQEAARLPAGQRRQPRPQRHHPSR